MATVSIAPQPVLIAVKAALQPFEGNHDLAAAQSAQWTTLVHCAAAAQFAVEQNLMLTLDGYEISLLLPFMGDANP